MEKPNLNIIKSRRHRFILPDLFIMILLLSSIAISAQPVTILDDFIFGGDSLDILLESVIASDAGFVLGCQSRSNGSTGNKTAAKHGLSDYWIVKADKNGNWQWDFSFGGINQELFRDIINTNDNGYLLLGSSNSPNNTGNKMAIHHGEYDYYAIKIDSTGAKQWEFSFGGTKTDLGKSVIQTPDNGYLLGGVSESGISGNKQSANKGGKDYWVVKIDSAGGYQWDRSFGGNNDDTFENIIETKNGKYILAGHTESGLNGDVSHLSRGGKDHWLLKMNSNGNKIIDFRYGGSQDDYSMSILADGGKLVFGGTSLSDKSIPGSGNKSDDSPGPQAIWVIKTKANGQKIWDNSFGGDKIDAVIAMLKASDGKYLMAGHSNSNASFDKLERNLCCEGRDIWLLKVKKNGDLVYNVVLGGNKDDLVRSIDEISANTYLVAGHSKSDAGGHKYDPANQNNYDIWGLIIRENN